MAWVRVRFEVLGEVQVSRAFGAVERDARDLSEPLSRIGLTILSHVHEQFRTEGAHSVPWKPLNPEYRAWKELNAPIADPPILMFSGAMRETLTSYSALSVSPRRLVYRPVGKHDDVAAYHQAGEGVPQRKVLNLTADDRRQWDRIFLEWLRRDVLYHFGPRPAGADFRNAG